MKHSETIEYQRLKDNYAKKANWLKWGPYLSERQWGTVREDYSPDGNAWNYFPFEHSHSRVYRWGEDGLAGICDQSCNLCFAPALWNGKDPVIKERLFGLTGPQGNHGEDVKELYYYLDSTPSHSYMKHLYKYPQRAFPYRELLFHNQRRTRYEPEYELLDTGVFDGDRYFDVFTEYAKADPEDILIRITVINRGDEKADLTVLPQLWFRNLWAFGLMEEKPVLEHWYTGVGYSVIKAKHDKIGQYYFYFDTPKRLLFTDNETNHVKLTGKENESPYVKDLINEGVLNQDFKLFEHKRSGTKFAPYYAYELEPGEKAEIRLRLCQNKRQDNPLKEDFENVFSTRIKEADVFYDCFQEGKENADLNNIQRQAFAGMLWTKQYYNIDIPKWLKGDKGQPSPPPERLNGRNHTWTTLNNEDIISMPDKWEYPWYAAWDTAFHCIPLALIDPNFAKDQLLLFLREWYMKPNGQIPAYEWSFSDVNPPVHAWAVIQVFRIDESVNKHRDIRFLKRAFHKLLLNFTWWVNRKDHNENNIFEGGFLGLDNIGVFDRSAEAPGGGFLEQADGTAWMAMYCLNMIDIAIEIAQDDPSYEDMATKFFEHFVYIAASLNQIGKDWTGSWNEEEGFFYDILALPNGDYFPIKIRSLVGLTTLFATLVIDTPKLEKVPEFRWRLEWFRNYRKENQMYTVVEELENEREILLSLIPRKRLKRLLSVLLDDQEFLSPHGIRSLSKVHETPYELKINGQRYTLKYEPAESTTGMFGGNSNWRGPVWFPMNYLIILSLREYYRYYEDDFKVEYPTGSGRWLTLDQVADDLSERLINIFTLDEAGRRAVHGQDNIYHNSPHFQNLILFYEYFHGDNGRGVGAAHQTGWTGLVAELIRLIGT